MRSPAGSRSATAVERWERFWWGQIPPHIYALLRILFGFLGCASLLQLRDLGAFWNLHGFVAAEDGGLGLKALVAAYGLENAAAPVLYFACLASFIGMTLGFRSGLTVALSLAASLMQLSWNNLPLSGAHTAVQVVLFCLIWADCGAVWSVDAWLETRREPELSRTQQATTEPIAPLRLVRFQVMLVYLSSGLWKLYSPLWRDGSAVHYVINQNPFHRFPWALPPAFDWLTTVATYATLFWELGFAFMVMYRPTRRLALLAGVLMHLGMFFTIEIGPFPWVMLASYAAFLDPERVPDLPARLARPLLSVRRRLGARASTEQAL